MGKLAGHLICLLIPIVISLLIASLAVLLSGAVQFDAGDWGSLEIIFSSSLILAMAFFIIALFVSCWVRSALGALFVSLGIWVLVVLGVPSVSLHIGAACKPISSRAQLNRQMKDAAGDIARQYDKEISDQREDMSQREIEVFFTKSYIAQQKARDKVYGAFRQKLYAQMELVRRIALISPFSCFLQIAQTFSGTGVLSERRFDEAAADFKWIALQYMVDKDEEFYRSGRSIAERVDITDVPRLTYKGESLSEKVRHSLLPISALIGAKQN